MIYQIHFEGEAPFLVLDDEGKALNDFPFSLQNLINPKQLEKGQSIVLTDDRTLFIKEVVAVADFTTTPISKAYFEIKLAVLGSKNPAIMIELNLIAEKARENRKELISYLELQIN